MDHSRLRLPITKQPTTPDGSAALRYFVPTVNGRMSPNTAIIRGHLQWRTCRDSSAENPPSTGFTAEPQGRNAATALAPSLTAVSTPAQASAPILTPGPTPHAVWRPQPLPRAPPSCGCSRRGNHNKPGRPTMQQARPEQGMWRMSYRFPAVQNARKAWCRCRISI